MRKLFFMKWFTAIVLLFLCWHPAQAGVDPPVIKVLDGSLSPIKAGDSITVQDDKYFDAWHRSKLQTGYPVENIVSLEINEGLPVYLSSNFTATVNLMVTTWGSDTNNVVSTPKTLTVSYNATGVYNNRATFVFKNGYRVKVKVVSVSVTFPGGVTPWNVWKGVKVVNQLQSYPRYSFSYNGNTIGQVSDSAWAANTPIDDLPVWWSPSIGADEYDLEWAYIDSAALSAGRYGNAANPDPRLIFEHNASRVSITGTAWRIPLLYDSKGHLFYRVRAVQAQTGGARYEAIWTTFNTNGHGRFNYNGHERTFNWQATTSFAEEGKRKSVVQYYDGSLRGRQTVTKDNSTNRTIVAESFYDYQGRPVIQVLPAPTLNTIIGYTQNFNRGINTGEYDKNQFDSMANPDLYCALQAAPMDSVSGASQYYSSLSPFKDSGVHKYVPNAGGFPFTEVEYTQDNTGRINRQSGVGKDYRLGTGHETKYFYNSPDQRELDALFGTEVGNASHYFKNTVRDANGQYSISYVDMHGRTIATALAGNPSVDSKLQKLPSNQEKTITETLADPYSAVIKDLVMESQKSLSVTTQGNHDFVYTLNPLLLKQEGCTIDSVCYDCLYDLEIIITDDCNNKTFGGKPFDTLFRNFSLNAIDTICNNGTGFTVAFTKWLPEGSYEITKKLSVSRYALDYYRDSVFMVTNHCKTLDDFITETRAIQAQQSDCKPTCTGCQQDLGNWPTWWLRFRQTSGIQDVDTAAYKTMALQAYAEAKLQCEALCNAVNDYTSIRQNMLMDMMPSSGQYANVDIQRDRFSVFYSRVDSTEGNNTKDTFPSYTHITNYRDGDGNPELVFDESVGKLVPPQKLTAEVFAQRFKPSWAEALLPKHPEFEKLGRYELLVGSPEWDRKFEAVETYAEAKAKGYLNPTGQAGAPATYFGLVPAGKDPVMGIGGTFFSAISDSLNNFRVIKTENGGSTQTISLWNVATIATMCKGESNSRDCINQYNTINEAFNTSMMCEAELDIAWRTFRQFYLTLKGGFVNKWVNANCDSCITSAQLVAAGYQPNFSDARELMGLQGPADAPATKAEAEAALLKYYDDNCRFYAQQWIKSLASCTLYDSAMLHDDIIPALVDICKEGSDLSHPYGASSVKPSSGRTYRSFEAWLEHYNATKGITDKVNCNAYGITAPKPYDEQAMNGNKPLLSKPDSCECSNVSRLYTKYKPKRILYGSFSAFLKQVYQTDIADSVLNTLLSLCGNADFPAIDCDFISKAIYLPPVFQCYTNDVCVDCEKFKLLESEFKNKFQGVTPVISNTLITDSAQLRRNLLYEQFMNHRLGFAKTAEEYLVFKAQCNGELTSPACDSLQDIMDSFKISRQQNYGIRVDVETEDHNHHTDQYAMIQNGGAQLPDTARRSVGSANIGFFLNGPGTFCGTGGYAVEARYKFLGVGGSYYANLGELSTTVYLMKQTTGWGPPGLYLVSLGDYYGLAQGYLFGNVGFTAIHMSTDTNSLNPHTIKHKITPSKYAVFFDGVLIREVARDPALPLRGFKNNGFGLASRYISIDWLKYYDAGEQIRYFEDFLDANNMGLPDPSFVCPSGTVPDCSAAFVTYFNGRTGKSYTANQIDSVYSANCGKLPNPCNNTGILQQIVDSFKINRQQNYGVTTSIFSPPSTTFTRLADMVQNGAVVLPDSIRQNVAGNANFGFTVNGGRKFCASNGGFSFEFRLKYLQNYPSGHIFYAGGGGLVGTFTRTGAGLFLTGVGTENGNFGYDFGGNWADSTWQASTDANMVGDWFTIKLQLTPNKYRFYCNGVLFAEFNRNPATAIQDVANLSVSYYSKHGTIDWVKVYDASGQIRYFEDYLNPDRPALPDPAFLCPSTVPDCQSAFVQYFNLKKGTSYTYSQINALYGAAGLPLNPCDPIGGTLRCDTLTNWLNDYKKYGGIPHLDASGADTTHWRPNFGGSTYTLGVPLAELMKNGVLSLPAYYRDTLPDDYRYDNIDFDYYDTLCLDPAGFTFETRLKVADGDVIPNFYKANWWLWLQSFPAINGALQTAFAYEGTGAAVCTNTNRPNKDCITYPMPVPSFNNWRTVKLEFRGTRFRYYLDDVLQAELTLDEPMTNITWMQITPWSQKAEIDYMRIVDVNGRYLYNEEFNDPYNLAIPDRSLKCGGCEVDYAAYFNERNNTSLSYADINALYSQCGITMDPCAKPDLTLCGRAQPLYPLTLLDAIDNCSDSTFFIMSKAQDLHRRYVDSVKGNFDNRYLAKCMQAYKYERFTVRHAVSEYHYTLYYYDQAGNLVKTIAPEGARPNYDSLWLDTVAAVRKIGQVKLPKHLMPTQYRYNTLNQMVAQKSPDGGRTDFWYDRLGRLVLSRNARQFWMSNTNNKYYSYIRYDSLGRITEVGQLRDTLNQLVNDTFTRNNSGLLAWHNSLLRNREQVTNTVYDIPYDAFIGVDPTLVAAQQNVRNRVSYVTYTDTPGVTSAYNHASFYSYDIHGNVDTLLQDYGRSDIRPNIMNKNTNRWKKLVYEYDLISGKVNKVKYQPGYTDQFTHRYYYDAENRLTEVETSIDGYTWEKEAKYDYYLHGPLARTTIGELQVQGVDFAYTLQGWLKGMNSTGATATHDIGGDGRSGSINQYVARDALGFNLNYFHGDYKAINAGVTPFPAYRSVTNSMPDAEYRPLYNGNISSMATSIRKFESLNHVPIFYNYRYDQLNRYVRQDAYFNFSAANNNYTGWGADSTFRERVAYDANGNIQTFARHAIGQNGALMDDLTYKYYPGTNQLRQVTDNVSASAYGTNPSNPVEDLDSQSDTSNYVYDSIGNIIADKFEKITSIKWNVYGKITEITRNPLTSDRNTTFRIRYTYDAQGNRIGKALKWYNKDSSKYEMRYTWYVRDAQGNLMGSYYTSTTDTSGASLQTTRLQLADVQLYGSSRLGMLPMGNAVVDNDGNTGPYINQFYSGNVYSRGYRQYELTNHLGNVLTIVSDRKFGVYSGGSLTLPNDSVYAAISYYEPDMLAANDYYPFGMLSRAITGPGKNEKQYRFGFNGKENDYEAKGWQNQQDYGMRIYDPRIGRFLSVDPLQAKYPGLTPYQYASNSPITNKDLDGLEKYWYMYEWHEKSQAYTLIKKVVQSKSPTFANELYDMGMTWKGVDGKWGFAMTGRPSEFDGDPVPFSKIILVRYYDSDGIFAGQREYQWHTELNATVPKRVIADLKSPAADPNYVDGRIVGVAMNDGWNESLTASVQADVSFSNLANYAGGDVISSFSPGSSGNLFTSTTSTNKQSARASSGNSQAAGDNNDANVSEGQKTILYHYTNEAGMKGILSSNSLRPSLKAVNPKDARHGDGQYLSDIAPGTKTPAQLSKAFVNLPYLGKRFTHFVAIDVTGLNVEKGRDGVFVIPNSINLNLQNRIIGSGSVQTPATTNK